MRKGTHLGLFGAVSILLVTSLAYADCPDGSSRTPNQVLQDHVAALVSGDVSRIVCDYAKDATVMTPGAVYTGRAQIGAFFTYFFAISGSPVTVGATSVTGAGPIILVEWTWASPHLSVGDGTDTFVIKDGMIAHQTVKAAQLSVH